MTTRQREICERYDAAFLPPEPGLKVGIARNVRPGAMPLHGLRHTAEAGTSGWFIWVGDYSEDPEFFEPLCCDHLDGVCPEALPYLALAPGWRFLVAPDHEDVWYDANLLDI
jgi:hypothetical protein